ncbi:2-oxo-4-hydroxy-4-carboxy-5-ureidoimidazoline decarboxylase [Specibacter cremeus]|uniref:2-oxo-4-hydroxy-4-carboxy-5-ureidoimidazoline decarboxylase n=1 Tax=Specibacter cremeus TaxID=1629051 RepID=UPI000F79D646|nr:2-oxo-4-hydroxy-4-carboxy-5-ureidoimidazoline decarboxylase [Specibacter cremeus]
MLLEQLNDAARADVATALRPCIDIQRWIDDISAARPFASLDALFQCALTAADPFTPGEIDAAMAHHPRIGERAAGSSAEAELSRREQAAVDPADHDVITALAEGNRDYEAKFDQVFLIRAAGRTPQEILDALHRRLENTAEQEQLIVAQQLREIALLRLKGVMSA